MHKTWQRKKCKKGVYEYELQSNGLTLVLCPMPNAGSATFQVIYKVGSRNETSAYSGDTHILEHMLFKGSKKYHGQHTGMWHLEELGAYMNASTYLDRTNYYETIDSTKLLECVVREADRMASPILRGKDLASEMHVVHQEMERGDNSPFRCLMQHMQNTAFSAHAYRIPTIGYDQSVRHVKVKTLIDYHDQFYVPNNAVVTVCGSFDPHEMRDWVAEYFGKIPPGKNFDTFITPEPPQLGEKRFKVHKGSFGILGMAWKGPSGLEQNAMTLEVMGKIFSNPKSLFHGGVVSGKYHSVVVDWERMRDPYLFSLYAPMTVHNEEACKRAEAHILNVLSSYKFTEHDLRVAKQALKNDWTRERESSQSFSMALTEAVGRGCAFDTVNKFEMLDCVSLKSLHECLGYFTPDRLTVGMVLPGKTVVPPTLEKFKPEYGSWEEPSMAGSEHVQNTVRTERGLYALYPSDRVHLRVHIPLACTHAKKVVMAQLVTKGVRMGPHHFNDVEVNDFIAEKGIYRKVEVLPDGLLYKMSVPTSRAKESMSLLLSEIKCPLLPLDSFKELKYTLAAECAGKADDVNATARAKFLQTLFTSDSVTYMPDFMSVSSEIHGMSHADTKMNFSASRVTCVAPENQYLRLAQQFELGGTPPSIVATARENPERAVRVHIPGKSSVTVMYGCVLPLTETSPDWIPLKLAVGALGNGFSGRLMQIVRDKYGLTYGISASVVPTHGQSVFQVTATFATDKVKLGIHRMTDVIEEWMAKGISSSELKIQKAMRSGGLYVSFDNTGGLTDYLHNLNRTGQSVRDIHSVQAEVESYNLASANEARHLIDLSKCTLVQVGSI